MAKKGRKMKKRNLNLFVLVLVVSLSALLFAACGSGGGGSSPEEQVAPSISNLQYWPSSVPVGYGGGATTVTGTIDFLDTNGNVTTLLIDTVAVDIDNVSGLKSGIIDIIAVGVNTTYVRSDSFKVSITDSTGFSSNQLTGTFTVY